MHARPLPILFLAAGIAHAAPPLVSPVQTALGKIDPAIRPDHYEIARADLNGDGRDDALALMNGKSGYAGSGGATLFVLKGTAEGFESLGSIKVVHAPIYLRQSVHHGFRDLLATVRGGGAAPGLSALEFDGKAYPAAPEAATATRETTDEPLFAEPLPPFEWKETLHGITFQVASPNLRDGNRLTVTPSGLEVDNTPVVTEVAFPITRAEAADLDADGSPEVYVYGFDGASQVLLAWSANKKKSLSSITLPELDPALAKGRRGGDEFAVVEGVLARRFPLHEDPPSSEPTGKLRQIQYKLHPGEAGWLLKVDRVVEF